MAHSGGQLQTTNYQLSSMAKATVNRGVSIFIETGEAEKAEQRLINKTKQLKEDLAKATDPVIVKRLNTELKTTEAQLDRVSKKVKGELTPSFKDLQSTVNSLGKRLKTMSTTDADFTKVLVQYQKAKVELGEMKGKVDQLNNGFQQSANLGGRMSSAFSGFFTQLGLIGAATFGVQGIVNFIGDSIAEFEQAELASARLEARLKNLDSSDAFDRLKASAEGFAEQFKFIDNDEIIGVFEQLINYGKLTEKQINQLTPVIIDFAAANRIDLATAASVVIKALEGNGKALKEYGITVTDAKNESEAFGIIMDQLKPKVEGAAEVFGNTLAGQAAIARQEIANLKEELGSNLEPITKKWYGFLADMTGGLNGFVNYVKTFGLFFDKTTSVKNLKFDPKRGIFEDAPKSSTQQTFLTDLDRQLFNTFNQQGGFATAVDPTNNVLGTGDKTPDKGGKSKVDRTVEEAKKRAAELQKISTDLIYFNASQIVKDLQQLDEKYERYRVMSKGNAEQLKTIDELNARERQLVIRKYYDELQKESDKAAEELKKKSQADAKRIAELFEKRQQAAIENIRNQINSTAQNTVQGLRDDAELKVLQASFNKRFAAKKEQLKLEEELEVAAAEKTGKSVELIREKYRKKQQDNLFEEIGAIIDVVGQAAGALEEVFRNIANREDQQLRDAQQRNDRERDNFRSLLDAKKISRQEYDRKINQLNEQQDKKEKEIRRRQFNRDKAIALVNATINTAQAVIKAFADGGPVLAAIAAVVGAIQIGIIASQKPPQFAKGGILNGPRHSNGGMPVINPATGNVEAEVEGGEAILSRRFVRNNPNLVAAALQSSKQGGYSIEAPWMKQSTTPINIPAITSSMQSVRRYETGGILPAASAAAQVQDAELKSILALIAKRLGEPFIGVVSLNSIEDAQDRRNLIVDDATMR